MHASTDKVIELFSGASSGEDMSSPTDTGIMTNPAKLCYVVKQSLREAAVGMYMVLLLIPFFFFADWYSRVCFHQPYFRVFLVLFSRFFYFFKHLKVTTSAWLYHMVQPIRSCVTFQFANLGENHKECSLEWLVNTDLDLVIVIKPVRTRGKHSHSLSV